MKSSRTNGIMIHTEIRRSTMSGDLQLTCSDCGQEFTFTAADQAF
ncbi:MAG: zinc-ribbon domain containing protein, partial [Acidobacteriota bacterium]|nr:zinc-ribbon domain containing protein [Acidobacteriota bacterium]